MRFKDHDLTQGQIPAEILSQNRHESYLLTYMQWLDETAPQDPAARQVMIIARSPASPVIQAVRALSNELGERQIAVRAVFSDVDPERDLQRAWSTISELSSGRAHTDLIKWVSAPGFLEAHEQLILGGKMCWMGDAMRREPGRRDGFDMFEVDSTATCLLAVKNFSAIWNFATDIPKWMLRDADQRKPSASHAGPDPRSLATLSFFRQLDKPDTLYH